MTIETGAEHIGRTHRRFAAIAGSYSLGVFNDNFFKQAVMILAVAAGRTSMQGNALAIFTLPFLVLAAPAGWLSDRFAKRHVIIACKWLEVLAMLFGAAGVISDNWPLIFCMLALMGAQSALFSPALNGSIPELYPSAHVIRANALLRTASTGMILLGIALAGIALDRPGKFLGVEMGRVCVGFFVLLVALGGALLSYGAPHNPPVGAARPFPWTGPWQTLRSLRFIARDRLLMVGLAINVFIWFIGSLQILIINPLGLNQFGFSKTATSLLLATQLLGLVFGGLLSSRLVKHDRWDRLLPVSSGAMGIILLACLGLPYLPAFGVLPVLYFLIFLVGTFGGLFLIPVESFLQLRVDPARKGEVWATANFAVFAGLLLSAPLSNLMNAFLQPTVSLGILGLFTIALGAALPYLLFFAHRVSDRQGRQDATPK